MFRGTLEIPPLVHGHALVFSGWTLLFLRQTWLAAAGRLDGHREWGAAGMGDVGRAFSIVSASAIALFAGLFTVAEPPNGSPPGAPASGPAGR